MMTTHTHTQSIQKSTDIKDISVSEIQVDFLTMLFALRGLDC